MSGLLYIWSFLFELFPLHLKQPCIIHSLIVQHKQISLVFACIVSECVTVMYFISSQDQRPQHSAQHPEKNREHPNGPHQQDPKNLWAEV